MTNVEVLAFALAYAAGASVITTDQMRDARDWVERQAQADPWAPPRIPRDSPQA